MRVGGQRPVAPSASFAKFGKPAVKRENVGANKLPKAPNDTLAAHWPPTIRRKVLQQVNVTCPTTSPSGRGTIHAAAICDTHAQSLA